MIDLSKWDRNIEDFDANKQILYYEIEEALRLSPNNVEYLWRRSWAAIVLANSINKNRNIDQLKCLISEAIYYSKEAIKRNALCFDAYISYCTAIGELLPMLSIKKRITLSSELKKHLDIAYSINKNNFRVNQMYGCYNYAPVPYLTWWEKKLVKLFCWQIPAPDYEAALQFLIAAHRLRPQWIRNYLWISKVLIARGKHEEGLKWLKRGLQVGFSSEEDVISRREILKLRQKYKN